jgi:hypothetical protein
MCFPGDMSRLRSPAYRCHPLYPATPSCAWSNTARSASRLLTEEVSTIAVPYLIFDVSCSVTRQRWSVLRTLGSLYLLFLALHSHCKLTRTTKIRGEAVECEFQVCRVC